VYERKCINRVRERTSVHSRSAFIVYPFLIPISVLNLNPYPRSRSPSSILILKINPHFQSQSRSISSISISIYVLDLGSLSLINPYPPSGPCSRSPFSISICREREQWKRKVRKEKREKKEERARGRIILQFLMQIIRCE
jgi:hypothetical protein